MSTINLLPEDYLRRRSQRRANVMCVILFAIVMAGVGGAALVSEQNTRRTIKVRDRVNADYDEAAKLLAQMQQLESQKRSGMAKAKATASLLEKVPRSYLLASITAALPPNTALTTLELKPSRRPSSSRTVAKIKGNSAKAKALRAAAEAAAAVEPPMELELVGWAATDVQVARFIANLLRDPLLASVDLSYSQEKVLKTKTDQMQVREFCLRLELRTGLDVIDLVNERPDATAAVEAPMEGAKL